LYQCSAAGVPRKMYLNSTRFSHYLHIISFVDMCCIYRCKHSLKRTYLLHVHLLVAFSWECHLPVYKCVTDS